LGGAILIMASAVPARAVGLVFRAQLGATEDVRLAVILEQVAIPCVNLALTVALVALATLPWLYAPVLGQAVGQILATVVAAAAVCRGRSARSTAPFQIA